MASFLYVCLNGLFMVELIITEKPSAANKIAAALADGKPIKKTTKEKVAYYELTHGDKDIIIVSAVGHLYGLAQTEGKKSEYPVFNIDWAPSAEVRKSAAFSKKYLDAIKRLAKNADEFTVATDYDIEGEVIGLNIVRYACKQKDAYRMKFSTLTKDDLIKAYENKSKHLDWGQARAGETRHSHAGGAASADDTRGPPSARRKPLPFRPVARRARVEPAAPPRRSAGAYRSLGSGSHMKVGTEEA